MDTLTDKVLSHRVAHMARNTSNRCWAWRPSPTPSWPTHASRRVFETARVSRSSAPAAALPQRPLWASTSTKNPAYPDTKYVDSLVGMYTVNTVPPQTLEALSDHGITAQTIEADVANAQAVMEELAGIEVDMEWVTAALLEEGVQAFIESYDKLIADLDAKRASMEQVA